MALKSVDDSSGLTALSMIKDIAKKSQQKFIKIVQDASDKISKEISDTVDVMTNKIQRNFDEFLSLSSVLLSDAMDMDNKSKQSLSNVALLNLNSLVYSVKESVRRYTKIVKGLDVELDSFEDNVGNDLDGFLDEVINIIGKKRK